MGRTQFKQHEQSNLNFYGDRVYIYGIIANSIYDSWRTNHPCIHQSRMSSSFFFSFEFQKHDLPFSSQTSSCVLYTNENRVSVTKYQNCLSKRQLAPLSSDSRGKIFNPFVGYFLCFRLRAKFASSFLAMFLVIENYVFNSRFLQLRT